MVRTQIQLTEKQSRILKAMSRERGVSKAELIRQSLDHFIRSSDEPTLADKYERALSVAGMFSSGETDLGRNHDRYLAEIYAEVGEE